LTLSQIVLLFCLGAADARASDVVVQGPSFGRRAEAVAIAQLARSSGLQPRVLRRYEHGEGWRWTVILRGFTDIPSAGEAAHRAAALTGRSYAIRADRGQEPVDLSSPAPSIAVSAQVARDLWTRATRAHGPADALDRVTEAAVVTFRFARVLPDGRRVLHEYGRRDGTLQLRFYDEARPDDVATYLVADGEAWATRGSAPLSPRDVYRTRELIQRFAPERVLRAALVLPRLLDAAAPLPEVEEVDGEGVTYLIGDLGQGRTRVRVDLSEGRVVTLAVNLDANGLERAFAGNAGGPLRLPAQVTTTVGEHVADRVEVLELSLESFEPIVMLKAAPTSSP
jgi:hypothetical protein